MTARFPSLRFACGLLALVALAPRAVAADAVEDFYKGKQMQLIVSTAAGGAYDAFGRLIAPYITKYLPGHPLIIVQNMNGANGLTATNYLANQAARDGTVIAAVQSNIPTSELLSPSGVYFKAAELSWIGSITKDIFVGYVWHKSPVQSMEDALTKTATMGGQGVGAATIDFAIAANAFVGTKFKIVTGYSSSNETKLALERGEVDGTFGNGWTSLKIAEKDWLQDGKIKIFLQHGFQPHAELPNVPLFINFAKTPADRQALELLLARQETNKPYLAPPGVPADRLNALRRAFDASIKDPEFRAAADKAKLAIDGPLTGEELTAMVAKLAQTPPEVPKRIEKMFADFQAGR
jgi:tripartite-type tricarboxylate transporter receptor subunit TctC